MEAQEVESWDESGPTALLVLADGTVLEGQGIGATGQALGEVCFNTAITGYQEILTDPSYAGQIITFTFPHIGNVGANFDDLETSNEKGRARISGCVLRSDVTQPSNWRSLKGLDAWLREQGIVGIAGVDTRALTARIRDTGMPNAVIVHDPSGAFDLDALKEAARGWQGIEGADLAAEVTTDKPYDWDEGPWEWSTSPAYARPGNARHHIVAIDYGLKRNILRQFAGLGCKVTVVPANTPAEEIIAMKPDGVFLSNGPGDPAATGTHAVPEIRKLIEADVPMFGICLGHQLLGLALGGRTVKMRQGHHGANHPVRDNTTGKVEITSMNHGFAVERESLPADAEETHVSLFDGTNCGIRLKDRPVFSVQYHPEASPGPEDSHYLFDRFIKLVEERKGEKAPAGS
ncbi:glutamine-hydrolyzing carbamoyl-phosphate synthase small subunit [Lutibaculum baratangense]|uniref:Carbamoyl phosphate synthase small chain n=1 Tax=Lutibaculum baratangense AMV1 TaxID=631454 RepID=V4TMF0_9HYPH|nr:glutamine-hydrolyzing carbamoyl-phosphate synthase small subunit [Lutibaculum baratangense]ESR26918.1 Carbamoyl-phosphate synthase small chain [Lutibaculum baratangense AMV1]